MRFGTWRFLFCGLICLLLMQHGYTQGFLKAAGQNIVDADGKPIILRGMGLGGWMLQEPYMLQLSGAAVNQTDIKAKITDLIGAENTATFYDAWLNNHCTKADIDSMKAWGFNSVRLPMHYNLYTLPLEQEPVPGKQTWLTKGFEMTDSLLSWCKANELYLILDLHAAPGGQGADNAISDRDSTKPSLWESDGNKEKTIALWQQLAQRYANEKWIGGYDLINETNWGFQDRNDKNGCAETANVPLRNLLIQITTAIRKVDTNHSIFIEGNCWANNYKGIFPLWDDNVVLSFHKYWNDNSTAAIQQFIEMRSTYNAPLWMGESGENSNSWFTSAITLFEQNNISWAWWPLKKMGANNPLQIHSNKDYDALLKYWKDGGAKPTSEAAFRGLSTLATSANIANNIYHKDVVDAMFRQVREHKTIPFKQQDISKDPVIYAVDFDLGRIGAAYSSKDSGNYWVSAGNRTQWNKGTVYRNDAVDIQPSTDTITNGYHVFSIEPTDWMQYSFTADADGDYNIDLRVQTAKPAAFKLFVNGQPTGGNHSVSTGGKWLTVTIRKIKLKKGTNSIKIGGSTGAFALNYIRFSQSH